MTKKISIKSIVRNDIRIALMVTFIWAILGPNIQVLKGLLEPQTVAVFMLVAMASKELLERLRKSTTFKTSTLYVIGYDILFLVLIVVVRLLELDEKTLIITIMVLTIPFHLLMSNNGIKLRAFTSKHYRPYAIEKIETRQEIYSSRVMVVALSISWVLGTVGVGIDGVFTVFIILSVIQSTYSVYNYRKHYRHLE